jgi:hypothetical protein
MEKNFPLDLQATPMGDYFLEMGPDIPNSNFVVVTRDGFRVRFNPEGKIQSRETLLRASVRSQFRLISERSDKAYLIVQNDERQIVVTDSQGKSSLRTITSAWETGISNTIFLEPDDPLFP